MTIDNISTADNYIHRGYITQDGEPYVLPPMNFLSSGCWEMGTAPRAMRPMLTLIIALVTGAAPLAGQPTVQLAPFNSIELPKGGHATVLLGPTPRVTVVQGSLEHSRFTVTEDGRLVVDKCISKCPDGYRLNIEIVASSVTGISLANGGSVTSRGGFPPQGELTVKVAHGGMIDVRSMVVDRVTAAVEQGGGIMTAPSRELSATVIQGGAITFWGDARVKSSVTHGGVVQRGDPRR